MCTRPSSGGLCNWGVVERECHPVNCVSWDQANAFCAWAGKALPTEEQWELAARGPDARPFPWNTADPPSSELLRWNTDSGTAEVGSHPRGATPEGVHDLAGNVWEWTASLWCPDYSGSASCSSVQHTDRGGSWASAQEQFVRSAFRESDAIDGGDDRFGFRCVK